MESDVAVRAGGCLTTSFSPGGAEWELEPVSDDPFVRQELVETTHHALRDLVEDDDATKQDT